MGDFNIHARIIEPSSFLAKMYSSVSAMWQSSQYKEVELVIKSKADEVFKKIGQGIITSDPAEFKRLKSNYHFAPISLVKVREKNEFEQLKPHEVAFIKIEDLNPLDIAGNLGQSVERMIKLDIYYRNKNALSEIKGDTIQNAHRMINDALSKNEFFEKACVSLKKKWSKPIEKEMLEQTATFIAEHPKTALYQIQCEKLQAARVGGSNTIQTNPKKNSDWLNADLHMRGMAESIEALTVGAICKLNALIHGDDGGEENEEVRSGQIRDGLVVAGGVGGPVYVHHSMIIPLLEELVAEINSGIENKENPVALASCAYQKMVSIHPFYDGNGRTCRLIMDYILLKAGLLPPSMEDKELNVAIFGDSTCRYPPPEITPTMALKAVLTGMERSYEKIKAGNDNE